MSDARPDTLLQRMAHWVAEHGDSPLFRFCDDSGKLVKGYTYAEMDEETTRLAALLRSPEGYDLEVGERVLLVFPPGLDFIVSYLSCMRAGLIPVPVFPPDPRKLKKDLYLFTCIHASCGAAIALTNSTYGWAKRVQKIKARFTRDDVDWPDDLHWLVIDNAPKVPVAGYEDHVADYDDVAFLQYTSGSTSEPKGVMVTHRALSHNLQVIVKSLRADESTVVVSWLPQYHDMGLIGSYLGALYCGGQGVYMSPFSFIKNPPLWMTLVNEYRGTHLQGPNFAYGLTARKWASRVRAGKLSEDGVDLSCVRHVFNAAEPVTQESIDAFLETFVPLGFPADSMVPGYGLAEHTVYVCDGHGPSGKLHIMQDTLEGDSRLEFSDEAKEGITLTLVGCGVPSNNADIDVRIVQPDSCRERGDAYVGEIWIHSESKAAGYWEDEERSQKEFHGMLVEGDDGDEKEGDGDGDGDGDGKKEEETAADEGRAEAGRPPASPAGYLRTGDLGFLYKGELFVCGRIKDLIIIRGRNHYPQDLEIMMEQNSELRGGCSAAFSVRVRGEEALVLMSEVRDPKSTDLDALVEDVRVRITRGFGVKPYAILLLAPRTIPKTTSGKIARQWCKRGFLRKTLSILKEWRASPADASGEDGDAVAFGEEGDGDSAGAAALDVAGMSTDELRAELLSRISDLVDGSTPDSLDVNVSLLGLGMDSMTLQQVRGIMLQQFGTDIDEEALFDEATTVTVLQQMVVDKHGKGDGGAAEDGSVAVSGARPPSGPCDACFGCIGRFVTRTK